MFTVDAAETTIASTTSIGMTVMEITTTGSVTGETSGGMHGGCGWNDRMNYYACAVNGGTPGLDDPDGIDPIDCPNGLVPGVGCSDQNGPVDSIGCCDGNILFFCARGYIYRDECQ